MVFIIMQEKKKSQRCLINTSFQNSDRIKSGVPELHGDDALFPDH